MIQMAEYYSNEGSSKEYYVEDNLSVYTEGPDVVALKLSYMKTGKELGHCDFALRTESEHWDIALRTEESGTEREGISNSK